MSYVPYGQGCTLWVSFVLNGQGCTLWVSCVLNGQGCTLWVSCVLNRQGFTVWVSCVLNGLLCTLSVVYFMGKFYNLWRNYVHVGKDVFFEDALRTLKCIILMY